jgi:pantoate--beta-alanine ligase
MEIVETVEDMASMARQWSFSRNTALVPTMGALHEGHLSLVRAARKQSYRVIVSIFVNPLQFGPAEDFAKYPRTLDSDKELLAAAGADLIFAPDPADLTPADMVFSVDPGPLGNVLCGKYRPGHFAGVTTIVTKLFQVVRPGSAFFGWKDAQQFLILRKMVEDLNMPLEMHGLETMREEDGLAMSSRNSYLTPEQRAAAPAIYRALAQLRQSYESGNTSAASLLADLSQALNAEPVLKLQYAEAVTMDSLEPVDTIVPGNTLVAVAAFAGDTRLIDNVRL